MIVRYRAQGLADIDAIFQFLHQHSPSGARSVLGAIYASIHLIGEQPLASLKTDYRDVRVKIVRRYRYKIFFTVSAEAVEILHVRHTARQAWIP
ncbi:MAG TPA: type II toxin-antitoxin system RelE/ParE family toxin [Rhizomicrobium sp.]